MGGSRKGPLSDEVLETPFGAETTPVWPGKDNNYFALFGNTNALRSALGLEPIPSKHARKPSQTLLVFNPGMKPKANSGIMETILDKCGILTDKVRALPQGGDKRARAVARLVMGKLKPPPSNGLWNLTGGPQPHILTFKNFYNNSCKARHIKTVRDYLSFFHVDPTWESVLNHVSPRPSAQPSSGGADPAVGAKRARTAAPGASGGGGDEEEEEASDESEIPAWAKKRQRSKTRQTEQTEQVERSLSEDLRFQTAGIAAAVRLAKDGISNIERLVRILFLCCNHSQQPKHFPTVSVLCCFLRSSPRANLRMRRAADLTRKQTAQAQTQTQTQTAAPLRPPPSEPQRTTPPTTRRPRRQQAGLSFIWLVTHHAHHINT